MKQIISRTPTISTLSQHHSSATLSRGLFGNTNHFKDHDRCLQHLGYFEHAVCVSFQDTHACVAYKNRPSFTNRHRPGPSIHGLSVSPSPTNLPNSSLAGAPPLTTTTTTKSAFVHSGEGIGSGRRHRPKIPPNLKKSPGDSDAAILIAHGEQGVRNDLRHTGHCSPAIGLVVEVRHIPPAQVGEGVRPGRASAKDPSVRSQILPSDEIPVRVWMDLGLKQFWVRALHKPNLSPGCNTLLEIGFSSSSM